MHIMKISDEYIAKQLRNKFGTYEEVAKKLGYSGYRPFRTALKNGLPEARKKIGMMLLLEESDDEKK